MSEHEKRITSETGGQKGQKEARLGGSDPGALLELARVYGMGEEKYARYNYLKGYPWSLSVDALFRHLLAFLDGEDRDPESGLLHTAHVAWHALTLTAFTQRGIGTDDRVGRPDLTTNTYTIPKMTADPDPVMAADEIRRWQVLDDLKRIGRQIGMPIEPQPDLNDARTALTEAGERYAAQQRCCACAGAVPHDGPCTYCERHSWNASGMSSRP